MSGEIAVAVVQTRSNTGDHRAALDALGGTIAGLAEADVDIAVIPEFSVSGYDLDLDQRELAVTTAADTVDGFAAAAVASGITLVTAIPRIDDDGTLRDASLVATPDGRIHLGTKRFLWAREHDVFTPGPRSGLLVETPAGVLGVVVCYEVGFPETVRELAMAGAEIIAVPAAFGRARRHVWRLLTRARAMENGCVVAAAGLCASNAHGVEFAGHSVLVDPRGERLAELGDDPDIAVARIARADIAQARAELPYLADLRRLGMSPLPGARESPAAAPDFNGVT